MMRPGDIVAERFEIEKLAGSGGMGSVYRAKDRMTGEPVAIKVLLRYADLSTERFAREAETLARLSHPRIVRYVTHGATPSGDPYLAMEWLDGEELSHRLVRAPLTVEESVRLARVVADTLGAAHALGVVHRDIKPSNLLIVDGDLERTKILDFGLARLGGVTELTATGMLLGTPGYMSPEQARLARTIDARADVFSLGCVLFKCLTGRLPFAGDDMVAMLAKILLEPAPRVADLVSQVPSALSDLVDRMLDKDPAKRPSDGAAVAAALVLLGPIAPGGRTQRDTASQVLTASERRLSSVVLARHVDASPPRSTSDVTLVESGDSVLNLVREAARRFGADVVLLADGSAVASMSASGAATDHAARAAKCALALRAIIPDSPMALAIGRTEGAGGALGAVIDRAALILRDADAACTNDATLDRRAIRVDDVTAGLLGGRFDVTADAAGHALGADRAAVDGQRTLLGKPTPCVGRTRELAQLAAVLDECIDEPMARVVLVTAPAGVGKSRLRYEFLRALAERGDRKVDVWMARGDPMSAGSPFGMLAPLLRRASGLLHGEALELRQRKVRERVAETVPGEDAERVAQFIGELVGAPFPDDASVQLRAARRDATLMGDQMRRAWEDFVRAECAKSPLLIVLEDLHWGDLPTVSFIDAALRNLKDAPFMVLALARPEVTQLFPKLWTERGLVPLPLAELTKKAAEKLAREALGKDMSSETIQLIVDRAAGNAFYLEELIRSVAAGDGGALPGTVLAMVQARLEALEPEARRVLRAASVFGQVFWRSGALALLGNEGEKTIAGEWLGELVAREVVTARAQGKFPGETEYVFRHALVRDAAYAMLTEQDRVLGHRLAAEWLTRAGEEDAVVLAEHFERGGDPLRAVGWFRRAAAQALAANDYDAVLARVASAVRAGATGEVLGALRLLEAEASRWKGSHAEAERCGVEAMKLLPRGEALWCAAIGEVASSRHRFSNVAGLNALAGVLLGLEEPFEAHHLTVSYRVATSLLFAGSYEASTRLVAHVARAASVIAKTEPGVAARIQLLEGSRAIISGNPVDYLGWMRDTAESFERAGDARSACTPRANFGYAYIELGAYAEAEKSLRGVVAAAERMGLRDVAAAARHNLGLALGHLGRFDEARVEEAAAIARFEEAGYLRLGAASRIAMAELELGCGNLEAAEREARKAVEVANSVRPSLAYALAMLANVLLARGKKDEALTAAREGFALLSSMGGIEAGESLTRLVYPECLHASGDGEGARDAIADAEKRLLARAEKITDATFRESFLSRVEDNARTLRRAGEWARVTGS